jgi:protein gp37
MGAESKIEWTDHTFNAWWGCVRVSPGCENCYAESFAKRTGHKVWGVEAPRRFFGEKHWKEPLAWDAAARKAGARHRVFCGSMMDVFELPKNPDTLAALNFEREKLWLLIEDTPNLDWQLLTKRPENWERVLPSDWRASGLPSNVWMGTTCEDQRRSDERIPHLLRIPARVRFLSCEPLLGEVKLREVPGTGGSWDIDIDWVIVGGESGGGARTMSLDWARSLVEQCSEASVDCFFKQFGAHPDSLVLKNRKGADLSEIPGYWPREFPR